MNRSELSQQIKAHALALGFSGCAVAPAERLDRDSTQLGEWIAHKRHGQMKYMARNIAQRSDPRLILSGAKSVISLLHNYYPVKVDNRPGQYRVSKYAYGRDHHKVIGKKLDTLMAYIAELKPGISARACVDSSIIFEKAWAARSGLGWVGKNSLLLTKQGSFFFLGEIVVDIELSYDQPEVDRPKAHEVAGDTGGDHRSEGHEHREGNRRGSDETAA